MCVTHMCCPQSDPLVCPQTTLQSDALADVSIISWPLSTWLRPKLTLISFLIVTFWPPAAAACTCLSLTLHANTLTKHLHFWRKVSHPTPTLTNPPWTPKYCIHSLVPNSALVWLPPRFLWIYKELVSIMNSLLNYWLLFTSLDFTVPFPPCFLSSITCPALTYLPVHLFRAFLTPSTLLFAQAVNLSVGGWAGARKEVGELRETWEKQWQYLYACMLAYVHLTCVPECVLHICFCLFVHTASRMNLQARLPKLFSLSVQTCPHLCMHIKRMHSYSPPLKPDSHIELHCSLRDMCVAMCLKDYSTLHGERRGERQIILIESGWDESQVHSALNRDLRGRPHSLHQQEWKKKKGKIYPHNAKGLWSFALFSLISITLKLTQNCTFTTDIPTSACVS